jgi:hypothetical protein
MSSAFADENNKDNNKAKENFGRKECEHKEDVIIVKSIFVQRSV